jgi:hypothetical protein
VRLYAPPKSNTEVFLLIEGEGENLLCPLYFGSLRSDGVYCVHPKGPDVYTHPGISQGSLFDHEGKPALSNEIPDVLYPYALRIANQVETGVVLELHIILAEYPVQDEPFASALVHYGEPYLVRLGGDAPTVERFEVPFSPEGRF